MKGYCLFDNIKVHNPETLEEYKMKAGPLVQKYGGKYIILGGQKTEVEGNWNLTFPVMIEFPSFDMANEWYNSEEYKQIKALRLTAVDSNGVIIEGM